MKYVITTLLLLISGSFYFWLNQDSHAAECNIEEGCLNDVLRQDNNKLCATQICDTTLSALTNKDFDQVIFLRKYQYDLSKHCGELKIKWRQQSLFADDCDYLVFSKGSDMTGYIRGHCFSANSNVSGLANNFTFLENGERPLPLPEYKMIEGQKVEVMLDPKYNHVPLLDQVFSRNQKIEWSHGGGVYLPKGYKKNYKKNYRKFACFTDFQQQAA